MFPRPRHRQLDGKLDHEGMVQVLLPLYLELTLRKIGFPVLTVSENDKGIEVRQDRFLETGIGEPEENETIW